MCPYNDRYVVIAMKMVIEVGYKIEKGWKFGLGLVPVSNLFPVI